MRRRGFLLGAGGLSLIGVPSVLRPAWAQAINIREVTTPAGIKAWLVEDHSIPVVSLSFSFGGGAALEPEGQKGVTSLMTTLLTDGAGSLPAQAFKKREEETAASIGFGASLDRISGSLRSLTANRAESFELLRLALTAPRFDADMIDQRRSQFIAGLNQASQRPQSVASRTLMATVFAGHPYSRESEGLRETLKNLSADDIRKRWSGLIDRSGLVIAAVGDITEAELATQLDKAFGALPAGTAKPLPPEWTPTTKSRTLIVERPVPQSVVQMAMPGIARTDPDWYPAFILNHILGGGGQQSRLFSEVREKRGLVYSISSSLRTWKRASLVGISTASANEKVADTVRVVRAELTRLRTEGVTEPELNDAKTYLTGALPVSLDSSSSIAGLLHSLQVDGLPRDQLEKRPKLIAAVTGEDVRRMARRLLRDDLLTTIVVGKPVGLNAEP